MVLVGFGYKPGSDDFAEDGEEKSGGQSAHQDAGQTLNWAEHPPRLGQHQIAVANRRVGDSGKLERRLGVWQVSRP